MQSITTTLLSIGRRQLAMLLVSVLGFTSLVATDVPVFRYGLEAWYPSPHNITVTAPPGYAATASTFIAQFGDAATLQFTSAPDATQAHIAVMSPRGVTWWNSECSPAVLSNLGRSPTTTRIAQDLSGGRSVVFLIVDGVDAATTEAFEQRLRKRLEFLSTVMELPRRQQDDGNGRGRRHSEAYAHIPLRLDLGIRRVRRDDPAEAGLIAQTKLLWSGSEASSATAPTVTPIFSRGRGLVTMTHEEITTDTIDAMVSFLLGACSCQVKEQNPGEDLMMCVNWEELLSPEGVKDSVVPIPISVNGIAVVGAMVVLSSLLMVSLFLGRRH